MRPTSAAEPCGVRGALPLPLRCATWFRRGPHAHGSSHCEDRSLTTFKDKSVCVVSVIAVNFKWAWKSRLDRREVRLVLLYPPAASHLTGIPLVEQ